MGMLSTVGNDGAFNAQRNPALYRSTVTSAGVSGGTQYSLQFSSSVDASIANNLIVLDAVNESYDQKNSVQYGASAAGVFSFPAFSMALAFSPQEYLIREREEEFSIDFVIALGPDYLRSNEQTEQESRRYGGHLGFALGSAEGLAFGAAVYVATTDESERSVTDETYSTGVRNKTLWRTADRTTMEFTPRLGIHLSDGSASFGLQFTPGTFARTEHSISMRGTVYGTPDTDFARETHTYNSGLIMTEAPGIESGILHRIGPVTMGLEASIRLPYEKTLTGYEYRFDESIAIHEIVLERNDERIRRGLTLTLRGGAAFRLAPVVELSLGGVYTAGSTKGGSGKSVSESEYRVFGLTTGADITFGGVVLSLVGAALRTESDISFSDLPVDPNFSTALHAEETIVSLTAALRKDF